MLSSPPYLASLQLFPLSHQAVLFSPVSPSGSTATYPVASPDPTYSTQSLSFSSVPSQISLAPSMLSFSSLQSAVLLTSPPRLPYLMIVMILACYCAQFLKVVLGTSLLHVNILITLNQIVVLSSLADNLTVAIEVASINTLRRILGLFIARWKMEFVCHVSKGYFGSVCQPEV